MSTLSFALEQGGIVVLDFGSQYSALIVRRVREMGVHAVLLLLIRLCKIFVLISLPVLFFLEVPVLPKRRSISSRSGYFSLSLPILGICYGMQWLVQQLGGSVERCSSSREFGAARINLTQESRLFSGKKQGFSSEVWMSHGDSVQTVGEGSCITARSQQGVVAAFECLEKKYYGVQFHPEVDHGSEARQV